MSAIIIDLDGTLCDVSHRTHLVKQSPPDWPAFFDACVDDTPNPAVSALYRMACCCSQTILYVSGRPETHRAPTAAWLDRHGLSSYRLLLLRPAGDYRPDAVVKRELYETHIAGRYDILFTVDDRDQVVAMWREMGLTCFQVADGDF